VGVRGKASETWYMWRKIRVTTRWQFACGSEPDRMHGGCEAVIVGAEEGSTCS
jgi:hypothetical protein